MSDITQKEDWKIIGYVMSGCVGCIVLSFLLFDLIRNFRINHGHNSQKYLSIISVSNALFLCIMVTFTKTDIFFRDLDHSAKGMACIISSALSGTFYIVSKFSMYILFTYRIELVFSSSIYAVSHKFLTIMRWTIVILGIMFCITTNFPEKEQIITPTYNISYCTVKKSELSGINFGSGIVISFAMTDLFILLWLLWLYNSKLYTMTKLVTGPSEQNESTTDFLRQIETQLIKSTILVSTSIISTLLFVFIGVFIWKPIGWFLPLDMTVNALSIYLMYSFTRKTYIFCCWICIKCCRLCIKSMDEEIFWTSSIAMRTTTNHSTVLKSIDVKGDESDDDDEDDMSDKHVSHINGDATNE